jgi:hypothetical protein
MTRSHPVRFAALVALLAVFFQALIPPGYMLAASGPKAGPQVVICTGHGPLRLADPADHQAPPGKQKSSGVCAFAGHGAPQILTARLPLAQVRWAEVPPTLTAAHPRVFIGRGLAAPPPARGPPSIAA